MLLVWKRLYITLLEQQCRNECVCGGGGGGQVAEGGRGGVIPCPSFFGGHFHTIPLKHFREEIGKLLVKFHLQASHRLCKMIFHDFSMTAS